MDKYIGRLLDNRYEILEVIGTGGMAVVYKARCHRLNRLVAIKILKDDYLGDEEFRSRFHSESQAVAMLSHPNIVSVYDVSTSIMADYIVMELIDGITLKQYMEKKGVLNWKETLHFAIQIAKALEHAHSRGIVHRDIKPHNVMVLKNGSVKVTDFGIARMMSKGNTLTKEALGSVHYISPEQAKGGRVDSRSDIYSLGVVMYEMMSGRPPYDGESPVSVAIQHINGGAAMPSTLNPNIPGGLEQIIMHAMAHEPESRYNSATKMLKDMDEFRKDPGILFDYNIPPLDEVIRINKPPLILNPEPATTAQKVEKKKTGTETPRRRTPESGKSHAARQREAEEDRRSNAATVAIIACSAVMVIAIVVFLVVLFSGANAKTQLVDVPNLVGEVYEELPSYPDFRVKLDKKVHDDTYPAGQIIDQNPVAGTQIEKNNTIYVTVSLGEVPQIVKMPNVVDWELSQAERALNNLEMNLQIKVEKIHHDEIAKGSVVRSEPEAETELIAGQEVTLYVSEGVEFKTGLMPDIVGDDKQSAIQVLKSQELDLQIVEEPVYDSVVEVGEVVRTDPEAGEELTTGQKITLYISKGPQLVELQNVVGLSVDKAVSILKGDGFENCKIEPMESDKPKDTVIELRAEDKVLNAGDELDINTKIIIYYSIGNGQETGVTKDVVINIGNATESGPCEVVVTRDGVEVFHETVPKGQTTITIPNQTGTGKVIYLVCTDDLDDWPYTEDFS